MIKVSHGFKPKPARRREVVDSPTIRAYKQSRHICQDCGRVMPLRVHRDATACHWAVQGEHAHYECPCGFDLSIPIMMGESLGN